jgi:hypothetical protein
VERKGERSATEGASILQSVCKCPPASERNQKSTPGPKSATGRCVNTKVEYSWGRFSNQRRYHMTGRSAGIGSIRQIAAAAGCNPLRFLCIGFRRNRIRSRVRELRCGQERGSGSTVDPVSPSADTLKGLALRLAVKVQTLLLSLYLTGRRDWAKNGKVFIRCSESFSEKRAY